MTDVVYIVRPGDKNDELRHSLRSLSNLKHDRVFFAGYKPSWVQGVEHIDVEQIPGQKHPNSLRNQWAAYTNEDVSNEFYLFNDDHFVMQKFDELPVMHWGELNHALSTCNTLGASFALSMATTRDILLDLGLPTINYQLHVPLLIPKQQMEYVFRNFETPAPNGAWIHQVTIAGNMFGWGGVKFEKDVKVHELYTLPQGIERASFLSTSDRSFEYGLIGQYIRAQFPEKCEYER